MMQLRIYLHLLTLAALIGTGAGCGRSDGPSLGTVTGTVTLDGEPVPYVTVTFIPQDKGSPSYGGTDEDGTYRLLFNRDRAGAEVGRHTVVIENSEPETDDSGNPINVKSTANIPARYRQAGTLTAEVEAGHNKVDFELRAKDGP